jgi:hypothetical protein
MISAPHTRTSGTHNDHQRHTRNVRFDNSGSSVSQLFRQRNTTAVHQYSQRQLGPPHIANAAMESDNAFRIESQVQPRYSVRGDPQADQNWNFGVNNPGNFPTRHALPPQLANGHSTLNSFSVQQQQSPNCDPFFSQGVGMEVGNALPLQRQSSWQAGPSLQREAPVSRAAEERQQAQPSFLVKLQ